MSVHISAKPGLLHCWEWNFALIWYGWDIVGVPVVIYCCLVIWLAWIFQSGEPHPKQTKPIRNALALKADYWNLAVIFAINGSLRDKSLIRHEIHAPPSEVGGGRTRDLGPNRWARIDANLFNKLSPSLVQTHILVGLRAHNDSGYKQRVGHSSIIKLPLLGSKTAGTGPWTS